MKGGCVAGLPFRSCGVPLLFAWWVFEWREWRLYVAPVFGLDPPLRIVLVPLALLLLSSSPPSPLPIVRVPCHSIVGLVLRLCGRAVSLWNSGDGLCWAEERVVSTVHCQLFMCVACVSVWCVWCVVSPLVFLFSLPSSSFLCWCSG